MYLNEILIYNFNIQSENVMCIVQQVLGERKKKEKRLSPVFGFWIEENIENKGTNSRQHNTEAANRATTN